MDIAKFGPIAASLASGTVLLSLMKLLVDRNVISKADAVAVLDQARIEIEGLSPSEPGSSAAKLVIEMITQFKQG
jgi:hypothetical protein